MVRAVYRVIYRRMFRRDQRSAAFLPLENTANGLTKARRSNGVSHTKCCRCGVLAQARRGTPDQRAGSSVQRPLCMNLLPAPSTPPGRLGRFRVKTLGGTNGKGHTRIQR